MTPQITIGPSYEVRVPCENLIGEENMGFMIMAQVIGRTSRGYEKGGLIWNTLRLSSFIRFHTGKFTGVCTLRFRAIFKFHAECVYAPRSPRRVYFVGKCRRLRSAAQAISMASRKPP